MRLNQYIARATGLSRRAADDAIAAGRVSVNGNVASLGQRLEDQDKVQLDGKPIQASSQIVTIMLNKPAGYVCSRDGQGSATMYELLPREYHDLKPVGRLDKDSTGLLLLTNDGRLAYELTHPKFEKLKVYEVRLNKKIEDADLRTLENGVKLDDGISHLKLQPLTNNTYEVMMGEGRKRQIRRTFITLGYNVQTLHRTKFGGYELKALASGKYSTVIVKS